MNNENEDDRITIAENRITIAENRIALLERALRELAATVSHMEAALEQFLEMVTPVTRTTGLGAQISAQEERLNWLDQATRELAAIVGFDAWQRIGAIITGNSEEGSDEWG